MKIIQKEQNSEMSSQIFMVDMDDMTDMADNFLHF